MAPVKLKSWLPWVALIFAGTALIVMGEISSLLSRLQSTNENLFPATALSSFPWAGHEITDALTHWAAVAERLDLRADVVTWLHWDLILDGAVLVPAYVILLGYALNAAGYRMRTVVVTVLAAAAADEAETWTTWHLVGDLTGTPDTRLATVVETLSFLKWAVLVLALGAVLLRWLSPGVGPAQPGRGDRIWRRHRVQVAVAVVLFLGLVAPLGGPLDQVPDVVRTWADGVGQPFGKVAGPAAGLLVLCVAMWVAGRWAQLDRAASGDQSSEPVPAWRYVVAGLVLAAAVLVAHHYLDVTLAGLSIAVALFVVGAVSFLMTATRRRWDEATRKTLLRRDERRAQIPDDGQMARVRYAARCLTVAPVLAVGWLLVRAYSGPALLDVPLANTTRFTIGFWLSAGVTLALGTPLLAALIALAEWKWLNDRKELRIWLPAVLGAVVLVAGLAVAVWAAADPLDAGAGLRVVGLITVALATVTVVLGFFQRRVEFRTPAPVFGRLARTPIISIIVVTVVLAGLLDAGRYHDVAVAVPADLQPSGTARTGPVPPLEQAFQQWRAAAADCAPEVSAAQGGRPAIPLIFVAAPGGGSRAAYWTAAALDTLTDPKQQKGTEPCGDKAIFSISGVSGGSVGAALWATVRPGAAPASAEKKNARGAAADLAGERPLAALLAATLYRDIPRMVHGVNGIAGGGMPDRARVLEEAWEAQHQPFGMDMMAVAPSTDPAGWRPLLLLNGTAVETGCRVVVAPVPAAVTHRAGKTLTSCRKLAAVADRDTRENTEVTPRRFAPGAVDARDYLGRDNEGDDDCQVPDGATFRLSTAALLSARFPYLTPTGALVRCTNGREVTRTFDVDGGYLENNGIALTLDLWQAMAPMVAAHNAGAVDSGEPLVAPMLVVLDNHYQHVAVTRVAARQAEVSAPITAYQAPKQAQSDPVMLQDAFLSFSGALPGLARGQVRVGAATCPGARVFRAAPDEHPGVEAPLGWVLSEWSQTDLRTELDRQAGLGDLCVATRPGSVRVADIELAPNGLANALQMQGGELNVYGAAPAKG